MYSTHLSKKILLAEDEVHFFLNPQLPKMQRITDYGPQPQLIYLQHNFYTKAQGTSTKRELKAGKSQTAWISAERWCLLYRRGSWTHGISTRPRQWQHQLINQCGQEKSQKALPLDEELWEVMADEELWEVIVDKELWKVMADEELWEEMVDEELWEVMAAGRVWVFSKKEPQSW